jgi:hypothetical protein
MVILPGSLACSVVCPKLPSPPPAAWERSWARRASQSRTALSLDSAIVPAKIRLNVAAQWSSFPVRAASRDEALLSYSSFLAVWPSPARASANPGAEKGTW